MYDPWTLTKGEECRLRGASGRRGEMGAKVLFSVPLKHKWQVQNTQGEVKNSMGNGEAKALIGTTYDVI